MQFLEDKMEENKTLQGGIVSTQNDTLQKETDYYFDIVNTHSVSLQSQITDNWLENGTAVHDHIAHSPITITLSGLRGELVYRYDEQKAEQLLQEARQYSLKYNKGSFSPLDNLKVFDNVSDKLTAISYITPQMSNITQLAKNVYDYSMASFNRYKSTFDRLFNRVGGEEQSLLYSVEPPDYTRLQEIYEKLNALWGGNIPMTVTTPFDTFSSMYIQSLTLRQDTDNYIADIELTLKQLKFANVETTKADENVLASYTAQSAADQENNGTAQGKNESLAHKLLNGG